MKVIDASVLAKYVLMEPGWNNVRDMLLNNRPLLSIPLIIKEVTNAIWKQSHLKKHISHNSAHELLKSLLRIFETKVIQLESQDKYLEPALSISLKHGIAIYDSLYIAQARKRRAQLVTSDVKQAQVAESEKIKVMLLI